MPAGEGGGPTSTVRAQTVPRDDESTASSGCSELPAHPPLRRALLIVAAAAALPGLGHVLLGRRRTGAVIAGVVLLGAAVLDASLAHTGPAELVGALVTPGTLAAATLACALVATAWVAVIVRTYLLARPPGMHPAQRALGATVVGVLCVAATVPFGAAANLASSQRALLDAVFAAGTGGADGTTTALPPRLNVLLLGSDAGPDRDGARTDTMIVASLDTGTAETVLFALPRNIQRAPFPAGSSMDRRFPDGFHDPADPTSGAYLLNALHGYGVAHPELAPTGPTEDPGMNLLMSAISEMLGLPLHHFVQVEMAGLVRVVDALGGVTVNVGPEPVPVGGLTASGRRVEPDGYVPAGIQHLDGEQALWFARARRDSDDYDRMARQRCLIDAVLTQNGPAELLTRFGAVADAATETVRTDIPRDLLPALVALVDAHGPPELRSVAFDPDLPHPGAPGGTFRPARPDVEYMQQVVEDALDDGTAGTPDAAAPPPVEAAAAGPGRDTPAGTGPEGTPVHAEPTCAGTGIDGGEQ